MASEQSPRVGFQRERKASSWVHLEHIPAMLLAHPQWVCWRYVDRGEARKLDKQPVNPRTLANAGVHWANTWTNFDEAYQTYLRHCNQNFHGIGFLLTPTDPYVAVDLDACVHEDEIERRAAQVVNDLGSYAEISPSGHGIRVLLTCPEFQGNARQSGIEVYSQSRYVTVTGHHVAASLLTISPISPQVIASLVPPVPEHNPLPHTQVHQQPDTYCIDDWGLWDRIFAHDQYGVDHLRRFQGDVSLDQGDHSFTVIRLLNCLARWTHCDPVQMRSMMLLSSLVNEKWFEKRGGGDWLDYQIGDAIAYVRRR